MKKIFTVLLLLVMAVGCEEREKNGQTSTEDSLFSSTYRDFTELEEFQNFERVSDTSIYAGALDPSYRLTELVKDDQRIVLFSRIAFDEDRNEIKTPVDTLAVGDLPPNHFLTIGYCEAEGVNPEEMIALAERTGSMEYEGVRRAWRANTKSERIEELTGVAQIACINEFYDPQ